MKPENKGQTVGEKYSMKRLLQLPASRFLPPSSGFLPRVWIPSPGSGSLPPPSSFQAERGSTTSMTRAHQLHSRQGEISHLEDLLRRAYDRQIPAITIKQMKIYAHCSTSTTLLTGSGHGLQLIRRVLSCSQKHIDTSCSLQHIDRSTIFSGHVPPRTDDSYPPKSYVLPRLRAH
ncbi:hypothetical protein YC2023_018588 [Brassica napus]